MTLEAWVNPSAVSPAWRDLIYKGDDNYYLSATSGFEGRPAGGAIFGGSYGETFGPALSRSTPGRISPRPTTEPRSACM